MELKQSLGAAQGKQFQVSITGLNVDITKEEVVLDIIGYEVDSNGIPLFRLYPSLHKWYTKQLRANNTTKVHPETGEYWDNISVEERPEGVEPIGEWDFFWEIACNIPIAIQPFILNTIEKNKARLLPDGIFFDIPETPELNG